jgi:gamma-glutamyltranspeptidase/glutathione hydrolase
MISSARALATDAGIRVLAKGGNAFDAAVAVAAMLNVVEPQNSGAGGYGLILIYDAAKRRTRVLNCSGRIPKSLDPDAFRPPTPNYLENRTGAKTIVAPVNARAWEELSKGYGKRPWASLFADAIQAAEEGFDLEEPISQNAYRSFPNHAKEVYGRHGRPLTKGERLAQKDLGRSLRMIAEQGAEVLYSGEVGRKIAEELRQAGSFVTMQDLRESKPEWGDPIRIVYRGYEIATAPPPANSFAGLLRMGIMAQWELSAAGLGSPEYWHRLAEALKQGEWHRLRYAGDPEISTPPLARLLSPAYWKDLAARVSESHAADFVAPGAVGSEGTDTTHFVTADRWGNIVSATQTLGEAFGSRVMAPGTGIWLNNSLYYSTFEPKGNPMDVHPGRHKLISNMPVIVSKLGEPVMALGAAGGHTIPQTVPQTLINMIDFRLDIQQAIAAPRISFVAETKELLVEPDLPVSIREGLTVRGHHVVVSPIGRLHGLAIIRNERNRLVRFEGGADPRGTGQAKGYETDR